MVARRRTADAAGRCYDSSVIREPDQAVEMRLLQALAMMESGIRLKRMSLREQHPGASEAELDELLDRWLARDA